MEILQGRFVKDITIVSLSSGTLGEDFVRHELEIGISRLKAYGIQVHFSTHALMGRSFVADHPECRAKDLLEAFASDTDMILCAIGGDDTYRLLPYLFEGGELQKTVKPKIFLGFSDSTINHFMLHKVGLNTFYGQSFLADVCEIAKEMLPYTKRYFEELICTGKIKRITPSLTWSESRDDFSVLAVGTDMPVHKNQGFELLQGPSSFEGEILGGCIDTIYDIFNNERYPDSVSICGKYHLFPPINEWKGKILLLETSEEQAMPELYRKMLIELKNYGIFEAVTGVLIGKPYNESYFEEYKGILKDVIDNPDLPVVVNLNVGHATPRCIVPLGVRASVDTQKQEILFHY